MAVPVVLGIAATAMQAVGQIQQAQTAAANARAQQATANQNALVLRQDAMQAGAEANAREEVQRRQFRTLQGEALAAAAQSGAGLDGSNADVLRQNAINAELDALTIRYEGQQRTRGLLIESGNQAYQGRIAGMNANRARTAGFLGAGATALAGVARYYPKGGG